VIAGLPPGLSVSADDDRAHPVSDPDPSWIETVWFPFFVDDVTVHARVVLRPNLGDQIATVRAWGPKGPLAERIDQAPLTELPDLRDARWGDGLGLQCLEPLRRYRLALDGDELAFDVTFDAVMEPNPVSPDESPGMFLGHLEQPGRIRGTLTLHGERHAVDCGSARDRSWGPRSAIPGVRLGNAFGTADERLAFFAYVRPDDEVERVTGGFLLLDGEAATVVGGRRTTTWAGQVPERVRLVLDDALGRRCTLDGRCRNASAVDAGHGVYAVISLVEWTADGGARPVGLGEDHDVWSRQSWLAAGRLPL
jgi:hypothetical protein